MIKKSFIQKISIFGIIKEIIVTKIQIKIKKFEIDILLKFL